ncbi:MAG: isocitrate lyase/PEP mutase family protein [Rhodospirillales bacterium]|nr:isocitrate lyase/PEP mutase family protein [Rhodospirillales bacterium]
MHWTPRRERFRALLTSRRCVHPGSVFDPISARIAEDLGFEVGMFSGSVASFTVLGAPDLLVLTLSEFVEQANRICRACTMPLLVDADHGYGNALNVKRTVEELETAGVAALTIEDTRLPQSYGKAGKAKLVSIDEGIGKMRAALAGRQDPTLVVVGRTSAPSITDIADTVARARAYETAGVDAFFVVGLKTRKDLEQLRAAVKIPLILGSSGPELKDAAVLSQLGVAIALQGHQPFMAAVQATYEALKALKNGTPPDRLERLASKDLMNQLTRDAAYQKWVDAFLGRD